MPLAKGVTANRQRIVLEELRKMPNQHRAARITGVSNSTIQNWRKRDPKFAAKFDEAIAVGVAGLEEAAWARAKDGVEEYVVSSGRVVMHDGKPLKRKIFSDTFVVRLLEAHDERYQRKQTLDLNHSGAIAVQVYLPDNERDFEAAEGSAGEVPFE